MVVNEPFSLTYGFFESNTCSICVRAVSLGLEWIKHFGSSEIESVHTACLNGITFPATCNVLACSNSFCNMLAICAITVLTNVGRFDHVVQNGCHVNPLLHSTTFRVIAIANRKGIRSVFSACKAEVRFFFSQSKVLHAAYEVRAATNASSVFCRIFIVERASIKLPTQQTQPRAPHNTLSDCLGVSFCLALALGNAKC